ncbi:MAG: histidine kinase dimerization/phospho-acceptor domain-containing protein, partial [Planctomycetota bacterium]
MSAQPQPNPTPPAEAGAPALSVYRGDAGDRPDPRDVGLAELLDAWNAATRRLEQTHGVLQQEVARLSDELEIKNRELSRKNRLADLGQMASHVAHEVRNNLSPVTLYLSLLRRRLEGDPAALETLSKVEAGLAALDATVNDLLS